MLNAMKFVLVFMLMILAGCASAPHNDQQVLQSSLTPGMAKKMIREGATSQAEIMKSFGPPNMVMKKSGKGEVWTYDKISVIKENNGYSVGSMLFGGTLSPVNSVGGGTTGFNVNGRTETNSVRTITILIEFDTNEVVQKYELMATSF
jgi:hypothetical protein